MKWLARRLLLGLGMTLAGCAATPREIFPALEPPVRFPAPPDPARIQYVGELLGSRSLGVEPRGWDAIAQALTGATNEIVFLRPSAVAIAGERVFVGDTGSGVIHVLDLQAREHAVIHTAGSERLVAPLDLAVVGDGLAVVDRARASIDLFALDGTWQASHQLDALPAPVALAWDQQRAVVWVADAERHAIVALTRAGDVVGEVGTRGGGNGQFNFPAGLAYHPRVGLVVADSMNFRVQILRDPLALPRAEATATAPAVAAPSGVIAFGRKGNAAGDFALPRDVAIDSAGHIYVLDNQFETIQVFDEAGRLLMAFGHQPGPARLAIPAGITIDTNDRIWVADSYNQRVAVFDYLSEVALCAL